MSPSQGSSLTLTCSELSLTYDSCCEKITLFRVEKSLVYVCLHMLMRFHYKLEWGNYPSQFFQTLIREKRWQTMKWSIWKSNSVLRMDAYLIVITVWLDFSSTSFLFGRILDQSFAKSFIFNFMHEAVMSSQTNVLWILQKVSIDHYTFLTRPPTPKFCLNVP